MLRRYGHDLHVSGEAEEADSLHSIRHFYSKLVDTVNLLTLLERPRWVFSSRVGSKLALEVTEGGGRERSPSDGQLRGARGKQHGGRGRIYTSRTTIHGRKDRIAPTARVADVLEASSQTVRLSMRTRRGDTVT